MIEPTWQTADGRVRLFRGDCLEVLPTLEAGSVQCVVTDPPYGIDYQSARRTDKAQWKPKIANDLQPFIWFLYPAFRASANPASLLCFCRWDVQEAFENAIEWSGWSLKSQVIWDREAHGMGDLNGSPAPQHDVIWFATKGKFAFHGERPKSVVRSTRLGGDQLTHPNEKPIGLMCQLVEAYCPPGGLVLDPFLGSASTAAACMRTGRRFIGVELDSGYFDIAVRRIEKELAAFALFEPPPATVTQQTLFGEVTP
jgi:site-specific DNA-methyltransferase (adenine-specific)